MIVVIILIAGIMIWQHCIIMKSRKKRHQMGHDELTGLCNWEHLVQKAEQLYKNDRPRYLIYSNIAEFKLINELFGREKGNQILQKEAEQLRKYATEGCLYGRGGEDHFIMILDQDKFHEEHLYACEKELQKVLADSIYNVRVCFGIYKADHFTESLESMCDKAAFAIESIKENPQEILAYYDETMLENALRWKKVVDEFEDALKSGEFQMYLQPQISATTGKLRGAEALARRIKPDGTMIPPIEFVPIYEKSGLICQMDEYIWEKAAQKLGEWKKKGIDITISVNISPKDFYYIDICSTFKNLVEKYQISPKNLNVEITETALVSDVPNLRKELERLRQMGFVVEIDDFGSGYSSLNTLKDIDVDVLKIDMGFLRKTVNQEKSRIILNSVVRMAKDIGMPVIAEGVENIEQVNMLASMGCDTFQGYYFSKPVSVSEFEEYIKNVL